MARSRAGGTVNPSFQQRMDRLSVKHGVLFDEDDVMVEQPGLLGRLYLKLGPFISLLIGILSVFVVRLAIYHVTKTAIVSGAPLITFALEIGGALLVALIILLMAFPFKGFKCHLALVLGVLIGGFFMHNAVHEYPDTFATLFSPEWTNMMLTQTEPGSAFILGELYVFAPSAQ